MSDAQINQPISAAAEQVLQSDEIMHKLWNAEKYSGATRHYLGGLNIILLALQKTSKWNKIHIPNDQSAAYSGEMKENQLFLFYSLYGVNRNFASVPGRNEIKFSQ